MPETPTVRLRLMELDLQGSGKSQRMTANRGSRLRWNERVYKKEIRGGCCLGRWMVGVSLMLQPWVDNGSQSLSLALCLWSDWYEKNYRSAMGAAPSALAHTTCTGSPLQSAGRHWWRGRAGGGGALQHGPSGQTSHHPPSQQGASSSPHLSIYTHPSIHLIIQGFTKWRDCNYEVEVRGGHSLCQITIIIIIIKMIYHHYSVFIQQLDSVV